MSRVTVHVPMVGPLRRKQSLLRLMRSLFGSAEIGMTTPQTLILRDRHAAGDSYQANH
jgi:hypothetical protein